MSSKRAAPHCCMAIGVAAISRFITPKPSAPAAAATMNTGWRTISPSGRPARRGVARRRRREVDERQQRHAPAAPPRPARRRRRRSAPANTSRVRAARFGPGDRAEQAAGHHQRDGLLAPCGAPVRRPQSGTGWRWRCSSRPPPWPSQQPEVACPRPRTHRARRRRARPPRPIWNERLRPEARWCARPGRCTARRRPRSPSPAASPSSRSGASARPTRPLMAMKVTLLVRNRPWQSGQQPEVAVHALSQCKCAHSDAASGAVSARSTRAPRLDGLEALSQRGLLFLRRESAFRPREHQQRCDARRGLRQRPRRGRQGQHQPQLLALRHGQPARHVHDLVDLRNAVAAALFAGGDRDALPMRPLLLRAFAVELEHAALRDQGLDAGRTQLRGLLDQPVHPFVGRHADGQVHLARELRAPAAGARPPAPARRCAPCVRPRPRIRRLGHRTA